MNPTDTNHILRLSDRQLAIVRRAAVPLSPSARDRYLKTVAAELAEAERVDDATVKAMVETRPYAGRSSKPASLIRITHCSIEVEPSINRQP